MGSFIARMGRGFLGFFTTARLVGFSMLAGLLFVYVSDPYPVQFLREKAFDIYQNLKPRQVPPADERLVVIIDIDERSLAEVGQYPWPRSIYAKLVNQLTKYQAAAITFDIVFPEADRMNPIGVVDSLTGLSDEVKEQILKLPTNDDVLAQSLKTSRSVLGQAGYWDLLPNNAGKPLFKSVAVRSMKGAMEDPLSMLTGVPTLIRNIGVLEQSSKGVGMFSLPPQLDGVIREVPLVTKHAGELYPSLSVEAMRVGFGRPTLLMEVNAQGISRIGIVGSSAVKPKGLKIPTTQEALVRPYFSPHNENRDVIYVSAVDVLNGTADISKIAGKFAFIGTSAVGLLDIRSTPLDAAIPGVEVHAQVVENALAIDKSLGAIVSPDLFLKRPINMNGAELLMILVGGILMVWLVPVMGATKTLILFVAMAGGAASMSWYQFSENRLLLDATYAVFSTFLLYSTLTYMNFSSEQEQRKQTRDAFSKYLSPDMVEAVAADPSKLKLGGDKRDMTLLFCDVRGFTTISEQFDAEGLTGLINKLLTPLTNVILDRKGTVDKYMGDCIMAFWNAPLDDEEHAYHGCVSALAMLGEMDPLNERLRLESIEEGRKHIPLKVGLGLNTGECVVGNMGSDQRFDYSVLGDTVNLAARLEGQSKSYGMNVVLGPTTNAAVEDRLATIDLDFIQVKGKTSGTYIYGLMGDADLKTDPDFIYIQNLIRETMDVYRSKDFDKAATMFEEIRTLGSDENRPWKLDINMDVVCDLYEDRIAQYKIDPPAEDWDGVFIATTK